MVVGSTCNTQGGGGGMMEVVQRRGRRGYDGKSRVVLHGDDEWLYCLRNGEEGRGGA